MKITDRIHALKIRFKVPVSPELSVDRFAFVYLIFGDKIHLIDSGTAGSESEIWEYIKNRGREPDEISSLILTHSHPDHIGAAKSIKRLTGCTVYAHKSEQNWVEDTEKQFKERPVPGFHNLVGGPVKVDSLIEGGESVELEKDIVCKVIHTPGHSKGSISLLYESERSLFTADALIYPGDLPIYEDISACFKSIGYLRQVKNVEYLFSSWESPIKGRKEIAERMEKSVAYLRRIHNAVIDTRNYGARQDIMELCQNVVKELGLHSSAVNPLVARAFASSLEVEQNQKDGRSIDSANSGTE